MAAERPAASVRRWQIVQCQTCGHTWDEENPEDEVCACIDKHGGRVVAVLSEGATNVRA